jgi:hypothetical protein
LFARRKIRYRLAFFGAALGMMGACGAMAIGIDEWSVNDSCIAHWHAAGGGADGYLSDSQATPYLAMMSARGYQLPDGMRISRADFIRACRAEAIGKVDPDYARIEVDSPSVSRRMVCESEDATVAADRDEGLLGSLVSFVKQAWKLVP